MDLFFTRRSRLLEPIIIGSHALEFDGIPYTLPEEALAAFDRAVIADHTPFILDCAIYDLTLNEFFRDLPAEGARSKNSSKAYARDILTWARWLAEKRGKALPEATKDDVRMYYRVRRVIDPQRSVSPKTWNRAISALDKLYNWLLERGVLAAVPFSYGWATRSLPISEEPRTFQRNQALEKGAGGTKVRALSLEQYRLFRDIGLLGRLPDGSEDPNWRGRNGARNAAKAEGLVTMGLRIEEATCLLRLELPDPDDPKWSGVKSCPLDLAPVTTKGGKGRTVRIPKRVLRLLRSFSGIERENAIEKAKASGLYGSGMDWLRIISWDRHHCRVLRGDGSIDRWAFQKMDYETRRRLLLCSPSDPVEPAMLWVTEQGVPTTTANWESIFRRASERCQRLGIDLDVTPHMLRHTFAVHMLSMLIREQIGSLLKFRALARDAKTNAYQRIMFDPLRKLQRLLGHASIESTYIYLDYVEEAQELVDEAADAFAAEVVGLDEVLDC